MVLTDNEKSLIEQLFKQFDKMNLGYIDKEHARGSTKMTNLIDGLRHHATGKPKGKIYLEDLIKFYEDFKAMKVRKGRDDNEDICAIFIEGMIKRQDVYTQRDSFQKFSE